MELDLYIRVDEMTRCHTSWLVSEPTQRPPMLHYAVLRGENCTSRNGVGVAVEPTPPHLSYGSWKKEPLALLCPQLSSHMRMHG